MIKGQTEKLFLKKKDYKNQNKKSVDKQKTIQNFFSFIDEIFWVFEILILKMALTKLKKVIILEES